MQVSSLGTVYSILWGRNRLVGIRLAKAGRPGIRAISLRQNPHRMAVGSTQLPSVGLTALPGVKRLRRGAATTTVQCRI